MSWTDIAAPTLADLDGLARRALESLPPEVRAQCGGLIIEVSDWPSSEMVESLGLDDDYMLTGLYDGVDIGAKSVEDSGVLPDRVWLFRRPILDEWCDRGNVTLGELITHILVHEIAHHLGLDDDDIAAIDDWTA